MPDIRLLGERITVAAVGAVLYEAMERDAGKRAVYVIREEGYAQLANYTCNFVAVIPDVWEAATSAFWFRQSDRDLSEKFHKRPVDRTVMFDFP